MDDAPFIKDPSLECLIFRCCGTLLGCETRQVAKIVPLPGIVPLPVSSGVVSGIFNYRGRILGAIDIGPLMGDTGSEAHSFHWLVLLKGSLFYSGLMIEEVIGIETIPETELLDAGVESPGFLPKTFMHNGRQAALLSVNMLLADPSVTVVQL